MKRYNQISSLVFLVSAIYVCLEASRLAFGFWSDPGPGFFPLLIGIILGVLSAILFLQTRFGKSKEFEELQESWYPRERWKKLVGIIVVLFGYAMSLEIMGFLLTTFILMVFLFKSGMGPKKWAMAIGSSAIASVSTYAIFNVWLKCQLPKGIFGF